MIFDDVEPPPELIPPAAEPQQVPEAPPEPELSAAVARFKACRWHAGEEHQEYCSNRDVLPYAGKLAFTAAAWCPDCALYKLRRTPRKHPRPGDDDYDY
ncbi:MAG: hypothetical protein O3A25_10270 [Acidobacteria bacterium]|nr:hypothetical protein [Acidobacteriota bacterium]